MPIYKTDFHVLEKTADGLIEHCRSIHHEAPSLTAAVKDACRFHALRVKSLEGVDPGYWAPLGAMKTGQVHIGRIDEDGVYNTFNSPASYEWKVDYGLPLGYPLVNFDPPK